MSTCILVELTNKVKKADVFDDIRQAAKTGLVKGYQKVEILDYEPGTYSSSKKHEFTIDTRVYCVNPDIRGEASVLGSCHALFHEDFVFVDYSFRNMIGAALGQAIAEHFAIKYDGALASEYDTHENIWHIWNKKKKVWETMRWNEKKQIQEPAEWNKESYQWEASKKMIGHVV
jgi:hypothetical protein